jgi:mannose-1-phosphate guanylyltransferase/mannose-1-phosphate guanylyltransferase/mannose-6-phosphate isomerase
MAGGSGTRLWPASNSQNPKQFLSAGTSSSGAGPGNMQGGAFFSLALERALAVTGDSGRVIIIAGKNHVPRIAELCSLFGAEKLARMILIPEPEAKNTAPAAACALIYAARGGGNRNMLLLTSDHIIRPLSVFEADAGRAASLAGESGLVVFGIRPSRPETGYGYIETESPDGSKASAVLSFREKPDARNAEQFVSTGRFFWNSGMFAFSSSFLIEEFRKNAGEVIFPFEKLAVPGEDSYTRVNGLRVLERWHGLDTAYAETKNISFDYAIAEKCLRAVMVKAEFDWLDVGNWDEYAALLGNTGSEVYCSESESCFVDSDIPVALCGVRDLIVTVRSGRNGGPPSVLILKKGKSQLVREAVAAIKKAGRTELL